MEAEKEKSGRRKIYTTPRPFLQSQKCIGQPSLIKSAPPPAAPLFPGDVMGDVDIQKKRGGKKGKMGLFRSEKGWGWGGILVSRAEGVGDPFI